jgi:hypothetical protein
METLGAGISPPACSLTLWAETSKIKSCICAKCEDQLTTKSDSAQLISARKMHKLSFLTFTDSGSSYCQRITPYKLTVELKVQGVMPYSSTQHGRSSINWNPQSEFLARIIPGEWDITCGTAMYEPGVKFRLGRVPQLTIENYLHGSHSLMFSRT